MTITKGMWDGVILNHPVVWRRSHLADAVRNYLNDPQHHVEVGSPISTHALLEAIYPEADAHGAALDRRQRLFDDLAYLAGHDLAGYASPGPEKLVMGRSVVPRLWHREAIKVVTTKPLAPQRWDLYGEIFHPKEQGEWVRWEDVKGLFDA